jgi:hypothetical protein
MRDLVSLLLLGAVAVAVIGAGLWHLRCRVACARHGHDFEGVVGPCKRCGRGRVQFSVLVPLLIVLGAVLVAAVNKLRRNINA